jgi:ribosome biogenesis GTPase
MPTSRPHSVSTSSTSTSTTTPTFEALRRLGFQEDHYLTLRPLEVGEILARVVAVHRDALVIHDGLRERPAHTAGRLAHGVTRATDLPAVGDYVIARGATAESASTPDGPVLVTKILPRRTCLRRTAVGSAGEQVIAANVDVVLIATAFGHDLNARRLERYLVMAWEAGATPLVICTKADLITDAESATAELDASLMGADRVIVSATTGQGMEELGTKLGPGRTATLVGSSGVGKSTLLNALMGREFQETQAVRASDERGRHTTTSRQLFVLPSGALLIDTPGMRELGVIGEDDAAVGRAFADVEELATACKFGDCEHRTEPGCAVIAAIESGALAAERLASFRKLEKERAYAERRLDRSAQAAERRKWKNINKAQRVHSRLRQRGS